MVDKEKDKPPRRRWVPEIRPHHSSAASLTEVDKQLMHKKEVFMRFVPEYKQTDTGRTLTGFMIEEFMNSNQNKPRIVLQEALELSGRAEELPQAENKRGVEILRLPVDLIYCRCIKCQLLDRDPQ